MPMSYSVLESFNISQFISRTVAPVDSPIICVCTAPLTPTVHKSLLLALIPGLIALGGGLLTVVVDVPFDVTVELLVESVTIGSAYAVPATPSVITVSSKRPETNLILALRLVFLLRVGRFRHEFQLARFSILSIATG